MALRELEERMSTLDKGTAEVLCEYLRYDSYLIVKNLAKIVNDWNAWNAIAYRDWALSRNEALIEKLSSMKTIDFKDRIAGKVDVKWLKNL